MKLFSKATLVAVTLGLFSASASADRVPREIYRPGGELVKLDRQGKGEYEVEYRLRGHDVRGIAKRTISHARSQGFRVDQSDIKRDDADLKFRRGNQRLEVQIEVKDNGRIEYKADLDKE